VTNLTDEQQAADTSVTLAAGADTAQSAPPSSPTPGAGPLVPTETAGPVVSPVATSGTGSGVPVVVWVGLVVLLLGVAALVWTGRQRRREDA
jgi:LPXTG-motif cell wall-anchored protein